MGVGLERAEKPRCLSLTGSRVETMGGLDSLIVHWMVGSNFWPSV